MKAEFVQSLVRTTCWMTSQGLSYTFINKQSSFVSEAREMTATNTFGNNWKTNQIGSGEFTYDKIFWIDSDIEWSDQDFQKLWESDLDIVSGVYVTGPQRRVAAHRLDSSGRPTIFFSHEIMLDFDPVEVGGVGFGFVAMKSGVFETVPRPWFLIKRIQWDDVEYETNVGEDFSFCQSAREAGYKIWIDPEVKVSHHKETVYVP